MSIDTVDPAQPKVKKDKKLKKSKKPVEVVAEQMDVDGGDAEVGVELEKTAKKRKNEDVEAGVDNSKEEKKKKKKRRRDAESADATPATGLDVQPEQESDSIPKKSKKEKKRKGTITPSELAETPAVSTSTESSATPAPPSTPAEAAAYLSANAITIHGDIVPILSFAQLDIPSSLRKALDGFSAPTPIQACSWPALLSGKDVVGIAETGSGKTLAFGLPALKHILDSTPVRSDETSSKKSKKSKGSSNISVLVIAPTRELAIQTHDTLSALGEPFGISSVCLYGGVDKDGQKKALAGKDLRIVVGTPGRILDLCNEGACDLGRVSYLVLDEADRMLDKGFENDIREIISRTASSDQRQTLMFSATWPESVRRLANTFQRDPVRITVGSDDLTANRRVEQIVEVFDDPRSKDSRLTSQLRALQHKKTSTKGSEESRILIFALYKKEASRVEATLKRQGYAVGSIHGDLSQSQRLAALDDFKTGRTGLLVATDVAARGLDIPNVGAVINYTFPLTIEDYIHRIGRTGRGGKSGKSITFFTGENHERALAGELARVLRESGFEAEGLKKFPMTIKKKEHSAYGAHFRDDIPASVKPQKIKF